MPDTRRPMNLLTLALEIEHVRRVIEALDVSALRGRASARIAWRLEQARKAIAESIDIVAAEHRKRSKAAHHN